MYVLIEIIIFLATIFFVSYQFINKRKYRIPFFIALVSTLVVECVNEFVFAGEGTYYPHSLLYFPFTDFTVGIVLLGTLYAVFLHYLSTLISGWLKLEKIVWKYLIYLVLLLFSIPFELSGLYLGYWKLQKGIPKDSHLYFYLTSVYIFYLVFTLPVFIVSEKVTRKRI